jgi:uncharacterized coiled-coil protein SlyX
MPENNEEPAGTVEARLTALEMVSAFLQGFSRGADGRFNDIETAVGNLRVGASAEMSQLQAENAKLKDAIKAIVDRLNELDAGTVLTSSPA